MRMTSGSCRSTRRSASANDAGVGADLALVDERPLALVVELDRVFDRDDVDGRQLVDDVHHRGQRRRLARTRRAGEQHEPARPQREVARDRRSAQFLERVHAIGMKRSAMAIDPSCRNTLTTEATDPLRGVSEGRLRRARRTRRAGRAHESNAASSTHPPAGGRDSRRSATRSPSTRMQRRNRPAVRWISDARLACAAVRRSCVEVDAVMVSSFASTKVSAATGRRSPLAGARRRWS